MSGRARAVLALLLGWLALAAVPAAAAAAAPDDAEIARFVDAYLAREVRARRIPGAAIVLLRDGRPILRRGYGVADLDGGAPLDVDRHLLRPGSTAKLLVWLLAMQLVEEGRLDLDRDVNPYLDFRLPAGGPVTMRHLLTHSSGFGDRVPMVRGARPGATLAELVRDNVPERAYPPGAMLAYSNYGAALAARIVERLRGAPFEQLVETRLFAPLGMRRSTVVQPVPAPLRPWLASTYGAAAHHPFGFERVALAPAGSMSASAGDMERLLAALMTGGAPIVRPATLAEMMRLQRPLGPGLDAGMGLGFIVGRHRGVRHAGHGGTMMSAAADLQILPEARLGWYVAFTGRGLDGAAVPLRGALLRAVIDRFYAAPAPPLRAAASTAAAVAGDYLPARRIHAGPMRLFGELNPVTARAARDGSLVVELEGLATRWRPAGRDLFVEPASGARLAATRGGGGEVTRIASVRLSNVTEYARAPVRIAIARHGLWAVPAILLLLGMAGAARRLLAWRRGVAAPRRARTLVAARIAIALTVAGWAGWLVAAAVEPGRADDLLPWLRALALAAAAAAVVLAVEAARLWRAPGAARFDRVRAAIAAPAAAMLVWLLLVYDVLDFGGAA